MAQENAKQVGATLNSEAWFALAAQRTSAETGARTRVLFHRENGIDARTKSEVSTNFNPRSLEEKIVRRSLEREGGGGGVNRTPPLSTFDTIYPIELKFGTYNKLHLYFQLSETTWCLIGFHGNNSQINDVTGGRHLGFLHFQILFKFSPQIDGKTAFSG